DHLRVCVRGVGAREGRGASELPLPHGDHGRDRGLRLLRRHPHLPRVTPMTPLSSWNRFLAVLGIALAPLVVTLFALPLLLLRAANTAVDALQYTGFYAPPILTLGFALWECARYVFAADEDERRWHAGWIASAMQAFVASLGIAAPCVLVGLLAC